MRLKFSLFMFVVYNSTSSTWKVSVRRQAYNSPALIGSLAHHPKIPCHAGALKKGVNV